MNTRLLIRATVLAAFVLPAAAKPLKSSFAFDEKSRDALVIVETAPQNIVEEWQISMNTYSLETYRFVGSVFKGFSLVQRIDGEEKSPRFFASVVKPGTHILYGLTSQVAWGACFDKGARAYTFESGKAYYLGRLDPNEGLRRLVTELPKVSRGTPYWVYGLSMPLVAPARKEGWEQDVAKFLAEGLPKVKAPVVAAEGVEVTFTPGKAPAGNPVCRANN